MTIFCSHRYFVLVIVWDNELLQSTVARNSNAHYLAVSIGQEQTRLTGSSALGSLWEPAKAGAAAAVTKGSEQRGCPCEPTAVVVGRTWDLGGHWTEDLGSSLAIRWRLSPDSCPVSISMR